MATHSRGLLAVCLAVLASSAAGEALSTSSSCAAERTCASQACTAPYAKDASQFPFTLDYTATRDSQSSQFVFKVCSSTCSASNPFCQPLAALQVRLADQIVTNTRYIKSQSTGSLVAGCSPRGPGLLLNSTQLKGLSTLNPSQTKTCHYFSLSLYHAAGITQLSLKDLCQQGVTLVDQSGRTVFSQAVHGTSCLYVPELADGTSGFGLVLSKDAPPTPFYSPPSYSPQPFYSPPTYSPQPASPSPVHPSPVLPSPPFFSSLPPPPIFSSPPGYSPMPVVSPSPARPHSPISSPSPQPVPPSPVLPPSPASPQPEPASPLPPTPPTYSPVPVPPSPVLPPSSPPNSPVPIPPSPVLPPSPLSSPFFSPPPTYSPLPSPLSPVLPPSPFFFLSPPAYSPQQPVVSSPPLTPYNGYPDFHVPL